MNIFYVHDDAKTCAQMHCDSHVVKMILEYSQLLSTAHRILDGKPKKIFDKERGKIIKALVLPNSILDKNLYLAYSPKHPSAIWARSATENYRWLYSLLVELHAEFEHRSQKEHASKFLLPYLENLPSNIPTGVFTQPTLSMPDQYRDSDAVTAYRNYYLGDKVRFATWKVREIPSWYSDVVDIYNMPYVQRYYSGLITLEEYELYKEDMKSDF